MKNLSRRYPSQLISVPKARREVASFARSCGLFSCDVDDIALAAGEACNNAAEHGHVHGGFFTVGCLYENGEFTIQVADEGAGFDPVGKGECFEPENLGVRGLGIFIMRSLMDDVCYTVNRGGTCVRMTKFGLASAPALAHGGRFARNGKVSGAASLGAMHHRLKTLFELARAQVSGRRQR